MHQRRLEQVQCEHAAFPLPGQTDITSGAVPELSWVRICCWY
ncbi:hypothetical protein [Streptomyces sp. NBC_00576]|nr:hypothetical protein [Streptomyces sp. NBC_00576]